jgi:hypothetical protein
MDEPLVRAHASAEFLLKQFELDIDRASWVVETAMEWHRDQQAEIPAPLLEGITRNLFSDRGDSMQAPPRMISRPRLSGTPRSRS